MESLATVGHKHPLPSSHDKQGYMLLYCCQAIMTMVEGLLCCSFSPLDRQDDLLEVSYILLVDCKIFEFRAAPVLPWWARTLSGR